MGRTEILGAIVEDLTLLQEEELLHVQQMIELYKADRNGLEEYPYDPVAHGLKADLAKTLDGFDKEMDAFERGEIKPISLGDFKKKNEQWLSNSK